MKISSRHLVWVNLVLLALVAYWGASTVSTAIAAKLAPSPQVHLSPAPPPIPREPRRPATYYAAIQTRDIFNSAKPEAPKPAEPAKPTECRLKLWGVAVHGDKASYCIIEDLTTRKQDLYRINDKAPGCGTVKRVEWDKVILDRNGQDEVLDLVQPDAASSGARPRRFRRFGYRPAANSQVHDLGDNHYEIARGEVDAALDNMNQLFTQIRAVPHFEGGKSTGFRLFAIRPNSIFDKLGLKNGDIIQKINGTDINDPSRALALFQELRNERQLTVQLLRNRQPETVSISIN